MNIYTLGTSHGDSTQTRLNSCYVYQTDAGALYGVDAGAPAEALIRRKQLKLRDIRALFITHLHDDHAGGLTGLIKQIMKYPDGREAAMALYLPESIAQFTLEAWMSTLYLPVRPESVCFRVAREGACYEDDEVWVEAIRTRHVLRDGYPASFAYALYFKKEKVKILHTGDLCADFSDFPAVALEKEFDLCLCEATHYRPQSAAPILCKAKFARLIFVHVWDEWQDIAGETRFLSYFSQARYPMQFAHDGDVFTL